MLHYIFDTVLGTCGLAWENDQNALKRSFLSHCTRAELIERRDGTIVDEPPAWIAAVADRFANHLTGRFDDFEDVALDMSGVSAVKARIYARLRSVHAGHTTTYGALAAAIGKPGAAQLVGQAMATNPFLVLVPCHRVVATNGQLGGFSAPGGVVTKNRLLAIEGVVVPAQSVLF